jgi:hypothetical protein
MMKEKKEHTILLDARLAQGCVTSFLAERKSGGDEAGAVRMAGELNMVLQLLHPMQANSPMGRMAKGMRREHPAAGRLRNTIWNIDDLLSHINTAYPRNEELTREELLHKTMLLIMIFAASRPIELARMETPKPSDLSADEAHVRAVQKQRGSERTSVVIHRVSITSLCPLEALREWLRKRGDNASSRLFTRESPESGPKRRTLASARDAVHYKELTSTYVRSAFKKILLAAGIPDRYTPYSIRHAVVTALFQRGASDEEVGAYGRWAPGSRVPRLFYFIRATDGAWIGEKLLVEQPSLKNETSLQEGTEESEAAEEGDEQPEADSSGSGEADGRA